MLLIVCFSLAVPGDPYPLKAEITPASAPTPVPPYYPLLGIILFIICV